MLAASRAAQDVALAARRGRGERQGSQRALAVAAGVDRDLVVKLEDGTGWPQLSLVAPVLSAFGASVRGRSMCRARLKQSGTGSEGCEPGRHFPHGRRPAASAQPRHCTKIILALVVVASARRGPTVSDKEIMQ